MRNDGRDSTYANHRAARQPSTPWHPVRRHGWVHAMGFQLYGSVSLARSRVVGRRRATTSVGPRWQRHFSSFSPTPSLPAHTDIQPANCSECSGPMVGLNMRAVPGASAPALPAHALASHQASPPRRSDERSQPSPAASCAGTFGRLLAAGHARLVRSFLRSRFFAPHGIPPFRPRCFSCTLHSRIR